MLKNKNLTLQTFDKCYASFSSRKETKEIKSVLSCELGFLLLDVCSSFNHPMLMRSAHLVYEAVIDTVNEVRIIAYTSSVRLNTIGECAMILLARADDGIRLLALETHFNKFYLCEYTENSHRNYGEVEKETVKAVLAKILEQNERTEKINMSKGGDWGDKTIICLKSDGIRRHRSWCEHYEGGECDVLCGKCTGSAHCDNYVSIYKINPRTPVDPIDDKPTPPPPPHRTFAEYYHIAYFGDKLLFKTVLIKQTESLLRIGYVTHESFRELTIEIDGVEHHYDKYVACKNRRIYLLEQLERNPDLTKIIL